jgi:hypothetical protein
MRIFEIIENKVVYNYIKSNNLMDRFIKLPWYGKMLISPIAILFFFILIFQVVIIFGVLYKVLLFLSKGLKEIFTNWKLVIVSFSFFTLSIAIIFISLIIFSLLLRVYIAIIPFLPDLILKLISFIVAPYLLLLFFFDSSSTLKNIYASIKAISESDTDLDDVRIMIEDASDGKSALNPLLWFMKSPFTIVTFASLTFIGALFAVIFVSVTINSSFPDVFFRSYETSINQLHFWFLYIKDQLLIIIPIDIMGPFLPVNSEKLVQQPWGGLLSILFQIFLAYMTFLYTSIIIGSAKFYIKKKLIK